MKYIVYVHGLSSSGATTSVRALQQGLPQYQVIAPDMPMNPQDAIQLLKKVCLLFRPLLVIGTSMGGMFTQQLHGQKKILINPAFHVSQLMRANLGKHIYTNPRMNGDTSFLLTEELCKSYEDMESVQFENLTSYDVKNTYGFFGIHDSLVNCQDEYLTHYTDITLFDGEHRLNPFVIESDLIPLIHQVLS